MKYKVYIRMIEVYQTEVEASSETELRKNIYEASQRWWEWENISETDRIKYFGIEERNIGAPRKQVFRKLFPDGEEPITCDRSWKDLLKEVKINKQCYIPSKKNTVCSVASK